MAAEAASVGCRSAGSDGVDPNAVWSELDRRAFGEGLDRGTTGRIGSASRAASDSRGGREVEMVPLMPVSFIMLRRLGS
jgi:hypothetical protein